MWLGILSYEVHLHKTTFAHASKINFIQCCFFLQQLSFFFPANVLEYLNGTAIPADHTITAADDDAIIGVSGIIPEQQYQQMLKEKHFGENTPQVFHGFNQDEFPFWSSKPMTYATVMLALTQYQTLLET